MIVGIIPARYASTRLPGKPLIDIQGKSMIRRVYEQASKSRSLDRVVVATDDDRIFQHVIGFGGQALMTRADHLSGTDRCLEAAKLLKEDYRYVINIQGDEPFIDPSQIDNLAKALIGDSIQLATLIIPVTDSSVLFDEGEAKVVVDHEFNALYFSRAVIPYLKNLPTAQWHLHHRYFRHVGMYAYRIDILEEICKLSVSPLEKAESLEQLRWLENGFKVKCVVTDFESHCVDSPADLEKVLNRMNPGR